MKILYIIHDFLPRHQAGAEIYTYLLAKELSKKHDICLFFTEINTLTKSHTITRRLVNDLPCIEVFRPPEAEMAKAPYNDEKMEDIFLDILKKFNPDIIHIQHLLFHSLRYPEIARKHDIPVVFTLHDYWLTCPRWGQRLQKNLQICHSVNIRECAACIHEQQSDHNKITIATLCRFFRSPFTRPSTFHQIHDSLIKRNSHVLALTTNVNLFIAPSRFLRNEFIALGIPENKIVLSDNGSNTDGYSRKKKHNGSMIKFGFIGTISEHKGLHVLVEAFNAISEEKASLQIYGDLSWFPAYSAKLRKMATSPVIFFRGPVPNDTVADILSGLDVLVVPSIWFENSPLTIHEAFLAGIPVITSNIGGMADLVTDRVSGLLFEVSNSQSLTNTIEELVQSETLLDQLRDGIPTVKSIEENGLEMEQRYQQLLN